MTSNCFEVMLPALAEECELLSRDIARLGAHISAGGRDMGEIQQFDILTQTAAAIGRLLAGLSHDKGTAELELLIAELPMPAVQKRLRAALGLVELMDDAETVFWMEAAQ